jgi:hypothetical protein
MPGAQRARSLACEIKKHTSKSPQVRPESPDIPRAMVLTGYSELSPVTGLIATVASKISFTNLTPASGRQDHTASPSTGRALVSSAAHVHRIPHPTSVTIAIRPKRDGMRGI